MELAEKALVVQHGSYEKQMVHDTKDLQTLLQSYVTADANVVLWQYNAIRWGRWMDGRLQMADGNAVSEDILLEVRAFNRDEELHVYRRDHAYTGRYIRDQGGTSSTYIDSVSRLWGEKVATQQGYVTLKDAQRFLTMTVSCDADAT